METPATVAALENGDVAHDCCGNDANEEEDEAWITELEKELELDVYLRKRSRVAFNLPHEVLMVLLSMVSVGRVCRAWSIAASEVAREKYRQGFEKLFCEYIGEHQATLLARSLESELHALHGYLHGCFLPKAYKETARRLKFNLRDPKNGVLRTRLFDGQLSLTTLVRMKASEMANPELVQQRKAWIRKRIVEVTRDIRELQGFCYSSNLFNCPSCGSNETQHSLSRRKASADRACIFVICCKCPYRWQVADGHKAICMWVKSPQEEELYARIFAMADVEKDGKVQGKTAVDLFTKSGLSPVVLKQVWSLASSKMLPYLDRDEFNVALGLIALAQKGDSLDLATLANAGRTGRLPLPVFDIKELQSPTSSLGNNQYNAVASVKQLSAATTVDEMLQTQVAVQTQLHSSLAGIPPVQLPTVATLLQPLQALGYHFPDTANTLSEAALDDLESVLLRYIQEVEKDVRTASGSMATPAVSVTTLIQTLSNLKQQSLRLLEQKEEAIARHGHSRPDLHVDVNFSQGNSSFDAPLTNWNTFEASAAPTTASFEATVGPSEADPFGFDAAFMGSTGGSHMSVNPTEASAPSASPVEKPVLDAFEAANSSSFSAFDAMNDMDWGFASNNQLQEEDAWNKPPKEAVRSTSVHSGFGTAPKQDLGQKKVSAKSLTTEVVPEAPSKSENAFAAFDDKNFGSFPATTAASAGGDFGDFTSGFGETRSHEKPDNDSFGDFATAEPSGNLTFGSSGTTFDAFPSQGNNFEAFPPNDSNDNNAFDAFPQTDFSFSQTSDGSGFGAFSESNASFGTDFNAFSAVESQPSDTNAFSNESTFGAFEIPSAQTKDDGASGFDAFSFSEQSNFSTSFDAAFDTAPSFEASAFPVSQAATNEEDKTSSPQYSSLPQSDTFGATGFDAFPSPLATSPVVDFNPPEDNKADDAESTIVSPPTDDFAAFEFSEEHKTTSFATSTSVEAVSFDAFNTSPPSAVDPLGISASSDFNSIEFGGFDTAPFQPVDTFTPETLFSDDFMEFGGFASTTSQERLSFTDAFATLQPNASDPFAEPSAALDGVGAGDFSSAQATSTQVKQTIDIAPTQFDAIDASFSNTPELVAHEASTVEATVDFSSFSTSEAQLDAQVVSVSLQETTSTDENLVTQVEANDGKAIVEESQHDTGALPSAEESKIEESDEGSDSKPTVAQDEERDGSFVIVPSPPASTEVITADDACGCFCLPTEDSFNNAFLPSQMTPPAAPEAGLDAFPSNVSTQVGGDTPTISPHIAAPTESLDFGAFSSAPTTTQESVDISVSDAPQKADFGAFSTTTLSEQPHAPSEPTEPAFGAFTSTTEDAKASHDDFPTTQDKSQSAAVAFGDFASSSASAFGDFSAAPSHANAFGDFVFPKDDSRAKSDPGIAVDAFANVSFASVPANPSDQEFADFADFSTAGNWASFSPRPSADFADSPL